MCEIDFGRRWADVCGRDVSVQTRQKWKGRKRTTLVHNRLVLDVLRADGETTEGQGGVIERYKDQAHLSVLSVSWRNLTAGERLQMRSPTEEPPRASCRMRVSFALR
jgi:hypothetical protein